MKSGLGHGLSISGWILDFARSPLLRNRRHDSLLLNEGTRWKGARKQSTRSPPEARLDCTILGERRQSGILPRPKAGEDQPCGDKSDNEPANRNEGREWSGARLLGPLIRPVGWMIS